MSKTRAVPVLSTIKRVVKQARHKAKFSSSSSSIQKNKQRKAIEKRTHSLSVVKKAKSKAKRKYSKPFYSVAIDKRKKYK